MWFAEQLKCVCQTATLVLKIFWWSCVWLGDGMPRLRRLHYCGFTIFIEGIPIHLIREVNFNELLLFGEICYFISSGQDSDPSRDSWDITKSVNVAHFRTKLWDDYLTLSGRWRKYYEDDSERNWSESEMKRSCLTLLSHPCAPSWIQIVVQKEFFSLKKCISFWNDDYFKWLF